MPWARTIRLQQKFHSFLWLLCVFSNLGNLLFAPQKLPGFKLEEVGPLEIRKRNGPRFPACLYIGPSFNIGISDGEHQDIAAAFYNFKVKI